MPSSFTHRREEFVHGFFFGPEVAQKFVRVARESEFLLVEQFLDGRVPIADALLGQ